VASIEPDLEEEIRVVEEFENRLKICCIYHRKVACLPPPYTHRLLSLGKERKYTKNCGQFLLYLKEHTSSQRKIV
jgi:hypothetical protein